MYREIARYDDVRQREHASEREERKDEAASWLGGLIFYNISDTHNKQKRQTVERRTEENCITFHCSRVHIYFAYTLENLISLL